MLNNRKIRLMTRLASYEEKEGKSDIRLSKYYKTDYVRSEILKTIIATTFGYLLILIMTAIYYSEKLIEDAVVLDYKSMGMRILGIYIMLLTIFIVGTLIGALIIGILNNGLNLLGVSSFYQMVVKGIVIAIAVLIDRKKAV